MEVITRTWNRPWNILATRKRATQELEGNWLWESERLESPLGTYLGDDINYKRGRWIFESLRECEPQGINPKKSNGPSPLGGKGIESHTNHNVFAFDPFHLLEYITTRQISTWMWTLIDSSDFCFIMNFNTTNIHKHYKKSCCLEPHYTTTKVLKQLIYNYIHYYKMWMQFISPCSLDQWIQYFPTSRHTLDQWLQYFPISPCSLD